MYFCTFILKYMSCKFPCLIQRGIIYLIHQKPKQKIASVGFPCKIRSLPSKVCALLYHLTSTMITAVVIILYTKIHRGRLLQVGRKLRLGQESLSKKNISFLCTYNIQLAMQLVKQRGSIILQGFGREERIKIFSVNVLVWWTKRIISYPIQKKTLYSNLYREKFSRRKVWWAMSACLPVYMLEKAKLLTRLYIFCSWNYITLRQDKLKYFTTLQPNTKRYLLKDFHVIQLRII